MVVCYHLDRVARDVAALLDTLKAWSRRGVELHVVGRGQIEAETTTGLLMTGIEGLLAEHYLKVISEKSRDALARLRAKGRRVSRFPPYGSALGPGGRLVTNQKEAGSPRCDRRLWASGRSLRAIARDLADRGILARSGRPFAPSTLWPLVVTVRLRTGQARHNRDRSSETMSPHSVGVQRGESPRSAYRAAA